MWGKSWRELSLAFSLSLYIVRDLFCTTYPELGETRAWRDRHAGNHIMICLVCTEIRCSRIIDFFIPFRTEFNFERSR